MECVAVFFGGQSVEHDVSVITGVIAVNALEKSEYKPIPIYVHNDGTFWTGDSLFDISNFKSLDFKKLSQVTFVAGSKKVYLLSKRKLKELAIISAGLNCIHGDGGEDGCISGLMKLCDIPFASPDLLGSSVCIDKRFTKIFLKGIGVNCLEGVSVKSASEYLSGKTKFEYPVIVKPNRLGSSIGINVARNDSQLIEYVSVALRYDSQVLIEPCLTGFTEINCAVYRNSSNQIVVSECEKPISKNQILTFGDKYQMGEREFPANIDKSLSNRIKKITKKVYSALSCEGIIRIDYLVVDNKVYLNELNTVPGSLAYYFFTDTLKGFATLLEDLIKRAIQVCLLCDGRVKTYKSPILADIKGKGCKTLVK